MLFRKRFFLLIPFVFIFLYQNLLLGTYVEINGVLYGAKADSQGPIGGGEGYSDIFTTGDYTVDSIESLQDALNKAKPGEVIYIPGDKEIDITTLVYIDQLILQIPEGVTLASNRGHNDSLGALILSDALNTEAMFEINGPDVRITGIRLQGPNTKKYLDHAQRSFGTNKPGHSYYYLFPIQDAIVADKNNLTVDNCEISGFGHAGIYLKNSDGHSIHHNYIHHCQYQGLGYGICHDLSGSIIEFNIFDHNRQSITGTGRPGTKYIARNNYIKEHCSMHCFGMHGGHDRNDDTSIAGSTLEIHNNTFLYHGCCIKVRGYPINQGKIYRNWFLNHNNSKNAINFVSNVSSFDNYFGIPEI